jgi:hypothetical protein
MRIPLRSGAYQAKSVIANAQRCVNLYVENNPEDSPFPTTHYLMPGLITRATSPQSRWRCLYTATNGVLFGVCGNKAYSIADDFELTEIGTLASSSGPVHMVDNSREVLVTAGTQGYKIDLSDNSFETLNQGAYYGGATVQYGDGFFVLPRPNSTQFYISKSFETTFDALDFASKTGFSDPLVTLQVTKRYVYLLGSLTTEVWYNAGNAAFPYERMPGAFIQHGCAAPQSVAQMDGAVYWLSQSKEGKCIVVRTETYEAKRISTHAIENEIQGYSRIDDAYGYTMQMEGHYWYVLTFPSAEKTWVFDLSNNQWCEWLWLNEQGQFKRHRARCFAYAYGKLVMGDWENGKLYEARGDVYTDDEKPIARVRSFPHMVDDGNRVMYREFVADFQVGYGASNGEVPVYLRWSDTKGKSWGNQIVESFGLEGDYLKSIQYQRLGMARDRVFELSWSAPVDTALNGAFVQSISANQ